MTTTPIEAMAIPPSPPRGYRALLPSAFCLCLAVVLPFILFSHKPPATNGPGPGSWPMAMIYGLMAMSAIWFIQDLMALRRGTNDFALRPLPGGDEGYSYPQAFVGLALIILYSVAMIYVGFAISTVGFIIIWCLYAGFRSPFALVTVALIGTGALLWVFMGFAMLPLPRGVGVFDGYSVKLLQFLRIY